MAISLADIFGQNASFNATTKELTIDLNDLGNIGTGTGELNGNGIDSVSSITALNVDSYASKILATLLLLHKQNQPVDDNDDTNGSYIEFDATTNRRFTRRNNVSQIAYYMTVNFYKNDSTAFDPDNLL